MAFDPTELNLRGAPQLVNEGPDVAPQISGRAATGTTEAAPAAIGIYHSQAIEVDCDWRQCPTEQQRREGLAPACMC